MAILFFGEVGMGQMLGFGLVVGEVLVVWGFFVMVLIWFDYFSI